MRGPICVSPSHQLVHVSCLNFHVCSLDIQRCASFDHSHGAVYLPIVVKGLHLAYHLTGHGHHRAHDNVTPVWSLRQNVLIVNDFNVLRIAEIEPDVDLDNRIADLHGVSVDMMGVVEHHRSVLRCHSILVSHSG